MAVTPGRRRHAIAAAVYVAALSLLVLWPLTSRDSGTLWDVSARLGYAWSPERELAADVLVSVLAFVPVGALLRGLPGWRRAALLTGVAFAAALEALQWLLAWRTASALDLAAILDMVGAGAL